jgi:hypothetical protein
VEAGERTPAFPPDALDREVDQVQIDSSAAQARLALLEGAECAIVPLVRVPELGRDEDLVPRDAALCDAGRDVALVPVRASGVDMAVAEPALSS